MTKDRNALERIREEFTKFERTMEELRILRLIAEELKNYRKMIGLKEYD